MIHQTFLAAGGIPLCLTFAELCARHNETTSNPVWQIIVVDV